MVRVAPGGWPIAAGEGASAITHHEGAKEGCGNRAPGAPDVKRASRAVQDRRQHPGVTGQSPGGCCRQRLAVVGHAWQAASSAEQGAQVHRHVDAKWPPARRGEVGGASGDIEQLGECVTEALTWTATVGSLDGRAGRGERVEHVAQKQPGLRVEPAMQVHHAVAPLPEHQLAVVALAPLGLLQRFAAFAVEHAGDHPPLSGDCAGLVVASGLDEELLGPLEVVNGGFLGKLAQRGGDRAHMG